MRTDLLIECSAACHYLNSFFGYYDKVNGVVCLSAPGERCPCQFLLGFLNFLLFEGGTSALE